MRRVLPIVFAFLLVVTACGDDDTTATTTTAATSTTTTTMADTTTSTSSTTTTVETTTTTTMAPSQALGASCTSPEGFSISYPSDWYVNDGNVVAECTMFDPNQFTVTGGTDERFAAITVYLESVPFSTVSGSIDAADEVSRAVTTIDDRPAIRVEHRAGDDGLYPADTLITSYFVDLGDSGETLVADTLDLTTIDYPAARITLDRMARTIELTTGPAPQAGVVADYEGGGTPFMVTATRDGADAICLDVSPQDETGCLDVPPQRSAARLDLEPVDESVTLGLAGSDVFRVRLVQPQGSMDYLPVPVDGTDGAAWAFPGAASTIDQIAWYGIAGAELGRASVDEASEVDHVGEFSTPPVESPGYPASGSPALLTDVRHAPHDGFERVVFQFDEGDAFSYSLEYVPQVVPPSGDPMDVAGDAILQVVMQPAAAVDLSGGEAEETYTGPERISPFGSDIVPEIVLVEDFESVLVWAIGLDAEHDVATSVLSDPLRLVVDISTSG
jgi:hypothetical protein